ncbi:hypothetical protein CBR_g40422 [Chara braunii]|uniref:MYB transcription factor n=1 Tax=Chara braunii TaxID=69332 RepID=A0A388LTU7_CHABU|nr:hypothetical protein CBR_g40422 [Chara braunii]GBG85692.1 hypothetical protein CBR_g40422 [Chara braunii]|eukprot:GBG85691.1 hypothetical protein CBR_g40422 [Chara braunii]
MTRRCSHCGHNGHNSRTCPDRGVRLFGVRLTENAMRKSVSTGNLNSYPNGNQSSTPDNSEGAAPPDGYVSDGLVQTSTNARERKKGVPWTEEEHRMFLLGLQKLGKGDWRGISRNYVQTRTPTQVASHAQKYFIRQSNLNKRKRRSSLFDIVTDGMPLVHVVGVGGAAVGSAGGAGNGSTDENVGRRTQTSSSSSPPPTAVPLHHLSHTAGGFQHHHHPSFFDPARSHSFPVAMPAFPLDPQFLHHMLAAAAATMPPQPSASGPVGDMNPAVAAGPAVTVSSSTAGQRDAVVVTLAAPGPGAAGEHTIVPMRSCSSASPPCPSGCEQQKSLMCSRSDGSSEESRNQQPQHQQEGQDQQRDGGGAVAESGRRPESPSRQASAMGVTVVTGGAGGGGACGGGRGAPLTALALSRVLPSAVAGGNPPPPHRPSPAMTFHHFSVLPWPGLSPLGYGLQQHHPHALHHHGHPPSHPPTASRHQLPQQQHQECAAAGTVTVAARGAPHPPLPGAVVPSNSNSKICRPTACIPTSTVPIPETLGLSIPSHATSSNLSLSPPSAEASSSLTTLRLLEQPSTRHSAFHAKTSFSSASLTSSSQSAISVV